MLQGLREVWLPWLLFVGTLLIGAALLALVIASPWMIGHVPASIPLLTLFADDATIRRTSIAAGIGLIVTACVFFRPSGRKPAPSKPAQDTMAGA